MRHFSLLPVMALGLALAACTGPRATQNASAPAPAMPTASAAVSGDDSKIYCISQHVTGSRLESKECHSVTQWAAIRAKGANDLRNQSAASLPMGDNMTGTGNPH